MFGGEGGEALGCMGCKPAPRQVMQFFKALCCLLLQSTLGIPFCTTLGPSMLLLVPLACKGTVSCLHMFYTHHLSFVCPRLLGSLQANYFPCRLAL